MNKITWTTFLPIIARYGVTWAYQMWSTIKTSEEPTEEQWQALLSLSAKDHDTYIEEAKARAAVTNPQPPPPV